MLLLGPAGSHYATDSHQSAHVTSLPLPPTAHREPVRPTPPGGHARRPPWRFCAPCPLWLVEGRRQREAGPGDSHTNSHYRDSCDLRVIKTRLIRAFPRYETMFSCCWTLTFCLQEKQEFQGGIKFSQYTSIITLSGNSLDSLAQQQQVVHFIFTFNLSDGCPAENLLCWSKNEKR